MKKRISLIAVIIAVGALAAAPFVIADPHRGGPGFGRHGFGSGLLFAHLQHVKEELDLSDQQVEQIKSIMADVHEQNAPYREQMHGGMKEVARVLLANPNDVAAAQAVLDRQAAAERAMKANMLGGASRALSVLDAEQRQELGTMVEKFADRHAGRRRK